MSKTTEQWESFANLCGDTEGRTAVAEVVRLRRELETMRDGWMVKAEQIHETTRKSGLVGEPIMTRHYKARAEEVTTILEGNNE